MAAALLNNTKTKYLLLIIVILIWGFIIVRIINGLSSDKTIAISESKIRIPALAIKEDSFSLINQYQDPFLTPLEQAEDDTIALQQKAAPMEPLNSAQNNSREMLNPAPIIPNILYKGFFQKGNKGDKYAIISINGTETLFHEKDKIADNTILYKITENAIFISCDRKIIRYNLGG